MNRKYLMAACQMDTNGDVEHNIEQAVALIREAADRGAKVAALPEYFNCLGSNIVPEPLDGPSITAVRQVAKEKKIWVNCGSITEENPDGLPYNTCVLINDEGEMVSVYRKLHLFDIDLPGRDSAYESATRSSGSDIVNAETPYGNFGLTICYDIRFPELYRILALRGAQILFTPANFLMNTGRDHWEPILRARAIENGCYVVAPCQFGKKEKSFSLGKTLIIDPWGNVIAQTSEGVGLALGMIDMDYMDKIRGQIPSLKNRRSDIYQVAVNKE